MPIYSPITLPEQLPVVGRGYEHVCLDLKSSARETQGTPSARFDDSELAKDIASFANALGGTVLVGAIENRSLGVVEKYEPLSEVDANETMEHYNRAVANLCSPRPLIQVARMHSGSGIVVGVNVWPMLGQLIGVSNKNVGIQGRLFRFPYRVGRNTVWLEPEQHAMFTIPEIRRIVILLESIPAKDRSQVKVSPTDPKVGGLGVFIYEGIDIYKNIVIFKKPHAQGGEQTVRVALDDVDRVWFGTSGWHIRLRRDAQF